KAGQTFRKEHFDCANELRFPYNIPRLFIFSQPDNFFVKLTYKITGKWLILRSGIESHCKGCFTAMSQDGHFCHENTKTAALALAGIPCACAPLFAEHSH